MKSLRTLALLPLAAAAAQAYTIEFQLGKNHPDGFAEGSVVGLNIATQVNKDISIGLNLTDKKLDDTDNWYNDAPLLSDNTTITPPNVVKVRNASLDITYELNHRGAIHPFVGVGIGYAWLSNTEGVTTSNTVMTTSFFGGIRFELSRDIDIAFNVRNNQLLSLKNFDGSTEKTYKNWESTVGLRFKF